MRRPPYVLPLIVCFLVTACGADGEELDGTGEDTTLPSDEGEDGTEGEDEWGEDEGEDEANDESNEEWSDEGEDEGILCECDGHGECVEFGGSGVCDCDPGFYSVGTTCMPCTPFDSEFGLDLPMVRLSGEVLVNGAPSPSGFALELVDHEGRRTPLTENPEDGFDVSLEPGLYVVTYEWVSNPAMPRQGSTRVSTLDLRDTPQMVERDVVFDTASLDGLLTVNGQAPPASALVSADVSFRDPQFGGELELASMHEGEFSVEVITGHTYEVVLSRTNPGDLYPEQDDIWVGLADIAAVDDPPLLQLDIPVVSIVGEALVNGEAAPPGEGRIVIEPTIGTGSPLVFAEFPGQTSYQHNIVPGTYRVSYEAGDAPGNLPVNQRALIASTVQLFADSAFDVDIASVTTSGDVSLDGSPFPQGETATLSLRDPRGDEAFLGDAQTGTFAATVVAGQYEVIYRAGAVGPLAPDHSAAILETAIDPSLLEAVDIQSILIAGDITIDGAPPPLDAGDTGTLWLQNEMGEVGLGSTMDGDYQAVVIPGEYELVYRVETTHDEGTVPQNLQASLGTVVLADSGTLDVDIPVVQLGGGIRFNGELAPSDPQNLGHLVFQAAGHPDGIAAGSTGEDLSGRVIPTHYDVLYRADTSTGNIPSHVEPTPYGCVAVE